MKKIAFFFLFISYINVCAADDVVHIAKLDEQFVEQVKVSGRTESGIMYKSVDEKADLGALYVDVTPKAHGSICVDIVSVDGKYKGYFEYRLKGGEKQAVRFDITSKHRERLSSYDPNQLVVLSQIQDRCEDRKEKPNYVLSSWGVPLYDSINIYASKSGSDVKAMLKVKNKQGKVKRFKCHKVKNGRTVVFDSICTIKGIEQYNLASLRFVAKQRGEVLREKDLAIGK